MLEIYYGDGKGKTTAAAGLAVRAAGHGIPTVFAQLMKNGSSGEIQSLGRLGIEIIYPKVFYGFVKDMSSEQKERMAKEYEQMLERIGKRVQEEMAGEDTKAPGCGQRPGSSLGLGPRMLVVLDEVLHACYYGLLEEDRLLRWLDFVESLAPAQALAEIVLTGRNPSRVLLERADYITHMEKEKHPYDKGIPARIGIEM